MGQDRINEDFDGRPLISVVTSVYNGADYLPDLIESVLAQDYPHYEHIIIDDGSTDDGATVSVLEKYDHLRWWSRENQGQYATQNEGIAAAQGELIVVIAADDVFVFPDTFSTVATYWRENPEYDLIYGQTRRMDATGKLLPYGDLTFPPWIWLLKHIVYVQHCSAFVSRRLAQQNLFDPSFRFRGDWDWLLRVFQRTQNIAYLRQPFAIVRAHAGQSSRQANAEKMRAEDQRIRQTYGGSEFVSQLIRNLVNWRAMIILGLDTLRRQGISAFIVQVSDWVRRRMRKRRGLDAQNRN